MRRGAEPECVEQEPEPLPRGCGADAQQVEDLLLDVAPVDPHAARAQLPAVEHQVVRLRAGLEQRIRVAAARREPGAGCHLRGRGGDRIEIVGVRHGERMVRRGGQAVGADVLEQREVDHPQEMQAALVHRRAAQLQPQQAEHAAGTPPAVGHQVAHVSRLGAQAFQHAVDLGVGHELRHRRGHRQPAASRAAGAVGQRLAGTHPHPHQALRAPALALLGEIVDSVATDAGAAGHPDAPHGRRLERVETGVGEQVGELDELETEPQVGLVGPEPVDGLVPRDLGHRCGAFPDDLLRGLGHGFADDGPHVGTASEAHLQVELGELELPVGPQVLVSQAAGDLVVAVDAAHHGELLEQLRALRQRIEAALMQPAGHHEVAGAFGRGGHERGRLDLGELRRLHRAPDRGVHPRPVDQVALHAGVPQVQVAVANAQHLVHLDAAVDLERRWLRAGQHFDRRVADLDLAGGQLGVGRVFGPLAHRARHRQHVLGAQVVRMVHHALHDAGAVAQVDEGQVLTVLPAPRDPAADGHLPPDVATAQPPAVVGSHSQAHQAPPSSLDTTPVTGTLGSTADDTSPV